MNSCDSRGAVAQMKETGLMFRTRIALPIILGLATIAPASFADSVAVTSGPNGTVVSNGKPCRVITRNEHDSPDRGGNSTTITTGPGGLRGTTTVTPGGAGASSSVTVGSGSSSDGTHASSAAGSDCVIYKDKNDK